jgi:putative PEP-CTERM system TPR-repeat lipoprotein
MIRHVLAAAACVALLGACGARDPEGRLSSARSHLAAGDTKAAIVTLKDLLQDDVDTGEVRFLLGQALLASGDKVAAKVELDKASRQGVPDDRVVPVVARAHVLTNDFETLIDQYAATTLGTPAANADLRTQLALSFAGIGQHRQALAEIEKALTFDSKFVPARVLRARMRADFGDLPGALAEAEQLLTEAPLDPEVWQLKGDLLALGQGDIDAAMRAFRKAHSLDPAYLHAHVAILSILLAPGGDVDAAQAHHASMAKALPSHGMTHYFEAFVALKSGDTTRALEITQLLLQAAPDNAQILQLAGLTELTRGSFARAASHLAKQLLQQPHNDLSRRLLAKAHLEMGQPDRALAVLNPMTERTQPDAIAFRLAAQAELQRGNSGAADKYFGAAARLDPADTRSRAALALSRVRDGDVAGGLADLRTLAGANDDTAADLPLIATLINTRDFAAALRALDRFEKKDPKNPLPPFLRARILVAQGDKTGGRSAYARALQLQPTYFLAANALAELDLAEGNMADAKRRFDDVIKVDNRNVQALVALAQLKARMGASNEEIVNTFTSAIERNPREELPRLALVNFLLDKKDVKAALQAAQQAAAASPDHPDVVQALGRAQAANGDTNQSVATFNRLIQLRPNSVDPYLRLFDALWAAGKREEGTETLKRALLLDADNLAAQRTLFNAHVSLNQKDDAIAVARDIQRRLPRQDTGYLLEGTIPASQRQWEQALKVYQAGLKAVPDSAALAERVHVVLLIMKRHAEANQHADEWIRANPKNVNFPMYLGDVALSSGDKALAQRRYREVLSRDPDSAMALNNLAWLLLDSNTAEAVALAERANQLLPNRPVLMDTLAMALARQGQPTKGADLMRQALNLEPQNPQLRLNLAKLLLQAGNKPAARIELEILAQLGSKFPRHAEVSTLLKAP